MGIRLQNFAVGSILRNRYRFGLTVEVPCADDQLIVASAGLAQATADADFTLATALTANDGYLGWPIQPVVVLRNNQATANGELPFLTAASALFDGLDTMQIYIEGELEGVPRSETINVNVDTLTTPSATQRMHVVAERFYDRITKVRHQNKTGTWGAVTAVQFCVGNANIGFGDSSATNKGIRIAMMSPFKVAAPLNNTLKRGTWLEDGTSLPVSSTGVLGNTNLLLDNTVAGGIMRVPAKSPNFTTSLGLFTATAASNQLTKTAHGLLLGDLIRVRHAGAVLPAGLALDTTYGVKSVVDADNVTIHNIATPETVLDITVDGTCEVLRPTRQTRMLRLIYINGVNAEGV